LSCKVGLNFVGKIDKAKLQAPAYLHFIPVGWGDRPLVWSITPTFYNHLLCQIACTNKLQSTIFVSREKYKKNKKVGHKMSVKWTPKTKYTNSLAQKLKGKCELRFSQLVLPTKLNKTLNRICHP